MPIDFCADDHLHALHSAEPQAVSVLGFGKPVATSMPRAALRWSSQQLLGAVNESVIAHEGAIHPLHRTASLAPSLHTTAAMCPVDEALAVSARTRMVSTHIPPLQALHALRKGAFFPTDAPLPCAANAPLQRPPATGRVVPVPAWFCFAVPLPLGDEHGAPMRAAKRLHACRSAFATLSLKQPGVRHVPIGRQPA